MRISRGVRIAELDHQAFDFVRDRNAPYCVAMLESGEVGDVFPSGHFRKNRDLSAEEIERGLRQLRSGVYSMSIPLV
jgi:hypothetical protein